MRTVVVVSRSVRNYVIIYDTHCQNWPCQQNCPKGFFTIKLFILTSYIILNKAKRVLVMFRYCNTLSATHSKIDTIDHVICSYSYVGFWQFKMSETVRNNISDRFLMLSHQKQFLTSEMQPCHKLCVSQNCYVLQSLKYSHNCSVSQSLHVSLIVRVSWFQMSHKISMSHQASVSAKLMV